MRSEALHPAGIEKIIEQTFRRQTCQKWWLRIIAFGFLLTAIAFVVLFFWTMQHLSECSARGQELYKIGLRDGELFARNQIRRAELEAQIIEDQRTQLGREKL